MINTYGKCNAKNCTTKNCSHSKIHVICSVSKREDYSEYVGCGACEINGTRHYCEENIKYNRKLKLKKIQNEIR